MFDAIFDRVLKIEGGYSKHPNDRGGETYCGISRRFWPEWPGWARVDALKQHPGFPQSAYADDILKQDVKSFYKKNFWDRMKLDSVTKEPVAEDLFEMAVNLGIAKTVEIVRLSYANLDPKPQPRGGDEPKIMLPYDLDALVRVIDAGRMDAFLILTNAYQAVHYNSLVLKDKMQGVFLLGWLRKRCIVRS